MGDYDGANVKSSFYKYLGVNFAKRKRGKAPREKLPRRQPRSILRAGVFVFGQRRQTEQGAVLWLGEIPGPEAIKERLHIGVMSGFVADQGAIEDFAAGVIGAGLFADAGFFAADLAGDLLLLLFELDELGGVGHAACLSRLKLSPSGA